MRHHLRHRRAAGAALGLAALLYVAGVAVDPVVHALALEPSAADVRGAGPGEEDAPAAEEGRLCLLCLVAKATQPAHGFATWVPSHVVVAEHAVRSSPRLPHPAHLHPPSRGPPHHPV